MAQRTQTINEEIRSFLKDNTLVIGSSVVLKTLKKKGISKVFVAKNCEKSILDTLSTLQSLYDFTLEKLDLTNEQVGTLCKKPFSIAVVGVKKS